MDVQVVNYNSQKGECIHRQKVSVFVCQADIRNNDAPKHIAPLFVFLNQFRPTLMGTGPSKVIVWGLLFISSSGVY